MWITSSKSDPAYRFIKLYNKELAEKLRKKAQRERAALWVSSNNIDELARRFKGVKL